VLFDDVDVESPDPVLPLEPLLPDPPLPDTAFVAHESSPDVRTTATQNRKPPTDPPPPEFDEDDLLSSSSPQPASPSAQADKARIINLFNELDLVFISSLPFVSWRNVGAELGRQCCEWVPAKPEDQVILC
jgi:hypothetical protein